MSDARLVLLLITAVATARPPVAIGQQELVLDIGTRSQLFADRTIVQETIIGAANTLWRATKLGQRQI